MGLVGLSQPVTWHSSREWANEYNWTAMTPELIELLTSKWHFVSPTLFFSSLYARRPASSGTEQIGTMGRRRYTSSASGSLSSPSSISSLSFVSAQSELYCYAFRLTCRVNSDATQHGEYNPQVALLQLHHRCVKESRRPPTLRSCAWILLSSTQRRCDRIDHDRLFLWCVFSTPPFVLAPTAWPTDPARSARVCGAAVPLAELRNG